ncbi:hypothetical protein VNO77_25400 [Canavalia gladiata]|uniref:Uncharacterized protein n=1 Tax=Canavalia gladiata TaxID=3824 RepID=A0AAN9L817_CANGL
MNQNLQCWYPVLVRGSPFPREESPKKATCITQAALALSDGTICYKEGSWLPPLPIGPSILSFPLLYSFMDFLLSLSSLLSASPPL